MAAKPKSLRVSSAKLDRLAQRMLKAMVGFEDKRCVLMKWPAADPTRVVIIATGTVAVGLELCASALGTVGRATIIDMLPEEGHDASLP